MLASRCSCLVDDARRARLARGLSYIDWIVLRNRLSMLASRNKRLVGEAKRGSLVVSYFLKPDRTVCASTEA
jgi:hypothetical protein